MFCGSEKNCSGLGFYTAASDNINNSSHFHPLTIFDSFSDRSKANSPDAGVKANDPVVFR